MNKETTSVLRYPGGKYRALKKILPFVPLEFSEFREPFVGGGSMFIALKQLFPTAKYKIGDLNPELYCFWTTLRDRPKEFIEVVAQTKKSKSDGKVLYRELAKQDMPSDSFQRAMRFFVLNRITYSGTIDSGGYSDEAFHKRFTESNIAKLEPLSHLLQGVEIVNKNYEHMLFEKGNDVFIYLDPPYWNSKKSKLYGTNGNLHRFFNHEELAKNIEHCKHRWLMTCDDCPEMRGLFGVHNLLAREWSYGMTNVNGKRTIMGKELFVANYSLVMQADKRLICANAFN